MNTHSPTTSQSGAVEELDSSETFAPNWASDAPRGGRAVLNRILKESATVPLFFAQTLVQSLRDVGYNNTTSALCEHIDNAIEAGASEIRVYFRQTGRQGDFQTDIMVYDNGRGMPPNVLKVATAFGGSMSYGNRKGIGRFGMGMKTAALSVGPVMELYSWQEKDAIYNMTLDTNAIGRERANLVELPDPVLSTSLPPELADLFTRPVKFPKDVNEQRLFASDSERLRERLGASGTIVYMPECDRLTYATDRKLVDHAVKEMARIYRRFIAKGLKLYVNNRLVEAFDPTYAMPTARHTMVDGIRTKTSRVVVSKTVNIPAHENPQVSVPISVKVYALPIEEWSDLPRKVLKNDLHVYDGFNVSILRNEREVFAGFITEIAKRHGEVNWFRIEIEFPGELDEAFGVAANKQGVRPKAYVIDAINNAIGDDLATVREEIKRFQAKRATEKGPSLSVSEVKAGEADAFQAEALDASLSEIDTMQMEENLRGLAIALKRDNETDDEAFQRVKSSRYLIAYRHDSYWPFYHVEHKFGRVILTINTAHPFFSALYEPTLKSGLIDHDDEDGTKSEFESKGPIVALELLLLSLARTQSVMSRDNPETEKILDVFRRNWSETYRIQLNA